MTTPYHRDIRIVISHPVNRLSAPGVPEVPFNAATELSGWRVSIGANAPEIEYTPVGGLRPHTQTEAIIPDVGPGVWGVAIEWYDQFDQISPMRTQVIPILMPQAPAAGNLLVIELVPQE